MDRPLNRALRILQVTKSTGGSAQYVRLLARGLDPDQFSQTVVCLSDGNQAFAAELRGTMHLSTFNLEMRRFAIDPISDLRVYFALRQIIRHGGFNLIHGHASKPGFLTRLAARGSGIPVIYTPHCFSFHAGVGRIQSLVFASLEGWAARHMTSRILTVSDGERQLALDRGVGTPEQFVAIHTGINFDAFQSTGDRKRLRSGFGVPDNAFLVGTVGRLTEAKVPLELVRVAARVRAEHEDVHFVWVGSGSLEKAAKSLTSDLGLDSHFHFPGERRDVPQILHALDCFVLPSRWEGFPIALLEAMAAGLPIVATDIPGTNEAVRSGQEGWLVPYGDLEAMGACIVDLFQNRDRAISFGRAGQERVRREFSIDSMLHSIELLYQEVASGKVNP